MSANLLLLKKNGNTIEKIPFEIESITIFQFQRTLKIIKDILKEAQKETDILGTIEELMNPKPIFVGENEDAEKANAEADKEFYEQIVEALILVLDVLPEKGFELISAVSGINKDLLVQQKAELLFDIIDGIVEVNDVQALYNRGKKSLGDIMKKYQFKAFAKKKAAAKNVQA